MSDYREAWEGAISVCRERNDEITRLRAEVADLTKANGLLHGIVSNREEEISDLRAQLAEEKAKHVLTIQHSDLLGVRLESAKKALEAALPIVSDRCAGGRMITPREDASKAFYLIQSALSDEKST